MRKRDAANPYYGWYIAVTLAITETISWDIIYYAFSVFLSPMEIDLGWSRAELTGGFALALLLIGMALPVGAWIDQHSARFPMTIGSTVASLLVIAWSQVTKWALESARKRRNKFLMPMKQQVAFIRCG
jgi:hypothetical protein